MIGIDEADKAPFVQVKHLGSLTLLGEVCNDDL